ncbi:PREDICTED: substance-P receptor-like [Priapulus caudatus]|uniref:Substance-P receptor-like n=1 Tax=Priapulus caudatus TaxID=37621 RepID=A0ABM1ECX4_PRICU|nr:PREDICTED: substance-P receptor-like [Priapulus caudatus]
MSHGFVSTGNLLVIVVILAHQKMRTTTNFFLANLAFADMCVGIFCVYPNLYTRLWKHWPLGTFMCRLYNFVMGTSYTASVLILVVIAIERYLAILMPFKCRQLLTQRRLVVTIVVIWVLAMSNNAWKFALSRVIVIGADFHLCSLNHEFIWYYDVANIVLWYVTPLCVITFIYVRICLTLWRSATSRAVNVELRNLSRDATRATRLCVVDARTTHCVTEISDADERRNGAVTPRDAVAMPARRVKSIESCAARKKPPGARRAPDETAMLARKRVVRLLIVVVVTFAVCVLPYHVTVLLPFPIYYRCLPVLTGVSFVLLYLQSGINPVLYAILSDRFRTSMKEVFRCRRSPRPNRSSACYSYTTAPTTGGNSSSL